MIGYGRAKGNRIHFGRNVFLDRQIADRVGQVLSQDGYDGGRPPALLRQPVPDRRDRQQLLRHPGHRQRASLGRAHAARFRLQHQDPTGFSRAHQTPVVSLGKEIREKLGEVAKKNVYEKDLSPALVNKLWRQFRDVLEVLREAGKLGAVHMQFAPWVAFHPETFDYIEHCRAMLAGFTIAVEFRNATWFNSDKHTSRTLQFERDNGLVNVIVDEPQGIANTIPAVWEVTNPALALVRLHGRNHGTWNTKGLKASSQRFDYDYREDELKQIAGQVKALAPKAKTTHVLFNNN